MLQRIPQAALLAAARAYGVALYLMHPWCQPGRNARIAIARMTGACANEHVV